jgi:hydroxymethylpyrimidine pyrophosphatase-like HAD family hydrolase
LKNFFQEKKLSANRRRISKFISSVRVIYTDVDGTLVGPRACFFLDANLNYTLKPAEALLLAHKNNFDIVIISGRNRLQLLEDARLLGIKNYIAELGCQIVYDLGKKIILNANGVPDESPDKSVFEIIAGSGAVELLFKTFPNCLEYHTPWSEQRECTHLFRGFIDVDLANRVLLSNNFNYLKIVDNGIIGAQGNLKELTEIHAYHILPRLSGKCEAVKKDLELRKIPKESAVAIGNAVSDLALANEVGAFFLVKNALFQDSEIEEKIKQFDNVFITDEEVGLGFAEVVDLLIEAKSSC